MKNNDLKIYIAGHEGLVGSALLRNFKLSQYTNIITASRDELDLRKREDVFSFFENQKPEWVLVAAAIVGGIYANNAYPVEFLLDNLKIQNNIIEASQVFGVKKLLFLGSSCIYPKLAPQPIKEEYLLSSKLEETNEAYAIAKITGIKLCAYMNRQYGTNFISAMPTNLYGINDNYHKENAHVIPMLMRRFHEAKSNNEKEVTVWGTGTPLREFLFSDDLADGCRFIMENLDAKDTGEIINIGSGIEKNIKELALLIKETVGFKGSLVFDTRKPDGTPRKLMDISKITKLGWKYSTSLEEGLKIAYNDFLSNPNIRK